MTPDTSETEFFHPSMFVPGAEPTISVGVMDHQPCIAGSFGGRCQIQGAGPFSGLFVAEPRGRTVSLMDEAGREVFRSSQIRCIAEAGATFRLSQVTIGNQFHWQRREDQIFQGDLLICPREDGTVTAINEVPLETYLTSVISSEMNGMAPREFLKAHAILSRSWLLAALRRKKEGPAPAVMADKPPGNDGILRWYDREDHDIFDVCADDHCQRYQGITKIRSADAEEVVRETRGLAMVHKDQICDARYSKACGGLTEDFSTAWEEKRVPYLTSTSDGAQAHAPLESEEEAVRWILSEPEAYCNTSDEALLAVILPGFDRETKNFFRWTVDYSRGELEEILKEKSGIEFGTLQEIVPLKRGPSGRISRLRIKGSLRTVEVGKELEIRRWLSRSHLYSSAFVVEEKCDAPGRVERFLFHGAGWGHGVGLCQIGAAVMGSRGFSAEEILKHYFSGIELKRIY